MHILIIPSEPYVTKKAPLGAIFQYHQAHALKRAGYKVGVISSQSRSFRDLSQYIESSLQYEEDKGIPTYRYYEKSFLPKRFISREKLLRKIINSGLKVFKYYIKEQGIPDIIHAHNCLYAGKISFYIKKEYGIPYIITEHSSAYGRGLIKEDIKPIIKKVFKYADVKTVVSTKLGNLLENMFGKDVCPWLSVYNILENIFEKESQLLSGQNKRDDNLFKFLNIASLDSKKNHFNLLKAFSNEFNKDKNVKLRIGGNGPLRNDLEVFSRELGIEDQIVFLGLLNRSKVLTEMKNCDAFVLSSDYETFGVVLIEALACGKPVISTACGGPEDIVNKKNGILIPVKNVKALQEAMRFMYLNSKRYDRNLIRNGCINRFGEKAFINTLKEIYASVLNYK